ncbi:MAG: methyltransferase domain-containing protein [Acidimicrobiales bacterium]|nr:methyltransferase domain-containing protein [Acidimicrobiales bacterium]
MTTTSPISPTPAVSSPTPAQPTEASVDAFVDRLFGAVLGAQEVQAAYLGDRLGWYQALADHGPTTSTELAERTGTAERYAREWLEHQAAIGWLGVDDVDAAAGERRFVLAPEQAEVLVDTDSLAHVLPLARIVASLGRKLDDLAEAYRTGSGVGWAEHGDDGRESQALANRPFFLRQLADDLTAVAEVDDALRGGAQVADIGCGAGWSAIGLALAHPTVTIDGFDVDGPSIDMARAAAAEYGVADRVHFHAVDVASLDDDHHGAYDVVFAFECVHDMSDPVSVLATMRRLAGDAGTVVVMDERVGDRFTAPAEPVERLMYGYSLTCCLPDGMAHPPAAGTGTVMRPSTLAGYAREAGFAGIEVLPIENDVFRFYRLQN